MRGSTVVKFIKAVKIYLFKSAFLSLNFTKCLFYCKLIKLHFYNTVVIKNTICYQLTYIAHHWNARFFLNRNICRGLCIGDDVLALEAHTE